MATDPLTYEIGIDLGNDGTWAGADIVTSDVRAVPHMRYSRGRDQLRQLSPPTAGACSFALANDANQWDTTSSLAPRLPIRIRATEGVTTRTVWQGDLLASQQMPNHGDQRTDITGIGKLARLTRQKGFSTQLYQNVTTGTALGHILDAVGFPAGQRDLDAGITQLDWWWLDENETVWSAIAALLASEGRAYLYESGDGNIVYRDRHSRVTDTASVTAQAHFRGVTTEPIFSSISYDDGLRDVVNEATMLRKDRTAASSAAIWTHSGNLIVAASGTVTIKIRQSDGDPFTSAVSPLVADTDYTVVSGGVGSATLDRTSGSSATLTITADGTDNLELSGLQVRAQSVDVAATESITNSLDASTSITAYGLKEWTGTPRAEMTRGRAQELTNAIVSWHQNGIPTLRMTVHGNRHTTAMTNTQTRDIGDRIQVTETRMALTADEYWIEHIAHEVARGRLHTTTFGCESADEAGNAFIIGTHALDDPEVLWF